MIWEIEQTSRGEHAEARRQVHASIEVNCAAVWHEAACGDLHERRLPAPIATKEDAQLAWDSPQRR